MSARRAFPVKHVTQIDLRRALRKYRQDYVYIDIGSSMEEWRDLADDLFAYLPGGKDEDDDEPE